MTLRTRSYRFCCCDLVCLWTNQLFVICLLEGETVTYKKFAYEVI